MKRVVIAVLLASFAAPAAASPDPYFLFSQARRYWETQTYPRFLNYTVTVEVDYRGERRVEHYASAFNAMNNTIWVDPISDYERAHPATGSGFGFNLRGGLQPAPDQDFLGVPMLSPTYSFTIGRFEPVAAPRPKTDAEIVAEVRAQFHDPDPRKKKTIPSATPASVDPSVDGLREIAAVVAYRRAYTIVLVGDESVDGHDCFHLHLEPVHVDGRYRLRDLWLDKNTYATVRANTALNFVDGPGTHVPWTIDFGEVGGAQYIRSETSDGPVVYDTHHYPQVRIRFDDVRPRETPVYGRAVPFSAYLILSEPRD